MKQEKFYMVIGRFKNGKSVVSILTAGNSVKDIKEDCRGNAVVAWAIIHYDDWFAYKKAEWKERRRIARKFTIGKDRLEWVIDYLEQCGDIVDKKFDTHS